MKARLARVASLLAVALGGLLFAPVFSLSMLAIPLAVSLIAVALAAEATRRAWQPALTLGCGFLAAVATHSLLTIDAWSVTAARQQVVVAVTDGWLRTLDSTWPADPELGLFVQLLCVAAAVASVELLRGGKPLPALLPPLAVAVLAQAFEPVSFTANVFAAVAFCALAAAVLRLAGLPERRTVGRAARGRVSILLRASAVLSAVVVGSAGLARVDLSGRDPASLRGAVPRQPEPNGVVNPLDRIGDRLADPDRVLFRYQSSGPAALWSTVVLDLFDGKRWSSSARYQRLGTRVQPPPTSAPTVERTAMVSIDALDEPWLPTPGRLAAFSGEAMVHPETGMLLVPGLYSGARYELRWEQANIDRAVLPEATLQIGAESTTPPELPASLTEVIVDAVGQEPPTFATALKLEKYFQTNYQFAAGKKPPTGHSYAQLEHFLKHSKKGTSEQFATAFVLLARAAGIPARLVVGFHPVNDRDGAGRYLVRNGDVLAWPEVAVVGLGWVALDPTQGAKKTTASAGVAEAPEKPDTQPEQRERPDTNTPEVAVTDGSAGSAGRSDQQGEGLPVVTLAAILAGLLVVAYPVLVPAAKARRSRRRRQAAPHLAVAGAWYEVRDRLIDAGLARGYAKTPTELAECDQLDEAGRARVANLAELVSGSLWSRRPTADAAAADSAWDAVAAVRRSLRRRPLRVRLLSQLSLRSLRRPG